MLEANKQQFPQIIIVQKHELIIPIKPWEKKRKPDKVMAEK